MATEKGTEWRVELDERETKTPPLFRGSFAPFSSPSRRHLAAKVHPLETKRRRDGYEMEKHELEPVGSGMILSETQLFSQIFYSSYPSIQNHNKLR